MRGTRVLTRTVGWLVSLWVVLLTVASAAGAAVAQELGHQNVAGDVHLWELARRAAEGQSPAVPAAAPAGDAYLYGLAQRVGAEVPATAGTDWTWAVVGALALVVVLAATMVVVTVRRHHWHPHLPVRRGHA